MKFVNFTNNSSIASNSKNFGFLSDIPTVSEKFDANDDNIFVDASISYSKEGRTIEVHEGNLDTDCADTLLAGDSAREMKINSSKRNPEYDMMMLVDKIRFVNAEKCLFRMIPVGKEAALICVLAGTAEVNLDGNWVAFSRNGYEGDNSKRKEYSVKELLGFVKAFDKESGYNMFSDGSALVEMVVTEDIKGVTKVSAKTVDFMLLDGTGVQKAREAKKKEDMKKEAHKMELREMQKEYVERAKAREESEASKKKTSTRRTSSTRVSKRREVTESNEEGLNLFRSLVAEAGYKR